MLARFVRIALALEIAAYAALATWLASVGFSPAALAAIVLALAFGSRFAFVSGTALLGAIFGSPRAPRDRIGLAGVVRLLLGEFRAVLADNWIYLPFERLCLAPEREPLAARRVPILLVHGYFSSRGYFRGVLRLLDARGVTPVFAPNLPGAFATIEAFAAELAAAIERIVLGTGQPQVVLVCHSMGGIAARLYLADHGAARVAKLVTIASPHAGTALARLGPGANARQMRRGSAFLEALAAREKGCAPCATTSIYSPHDNLVWPQETSRLAWARNIALPGLGHVGILLSRRMHRVLLEELSS